MQEWRLVPKTALLLSCRQHLASNDPQKRYGSLNSGNFGLLLEILSNKENR